MPNRMTRIALPMVLTLVLGACGGEPDADAEQESRAGATTAEDAAASKGTNAAPAKQTLPPAVGAFAQALRAISNGTNVRFESEALLSNGSTQYAIGAGSVRNASFVLRTLPQSSAEFDGNWLFQANRYLRESGTGFDISVVNPPAVDLMFGAIRAIPKNDDALASDGQASEFVGAVECTVRKVDLAKEVRLMMAYKSIDACVDLTGPKLIRLNVETQAGERLTATFSGHGESMQLPKTQVKDWSQEYPMR
jgi:hypothetical protein